MHSPPADQPPRDVDDAGTRANLGPSLEWASEPRELGFEPLPLRGEFPPPEGPPLRRRTGAWLTIAGIVAAGAFGVYHYWTTRSAVPPASLPAAMPVVRHSAWSTSGSRQRRHPPRCRQSSRSVD